MGQHPGLKIKMAYCRLHVAEVWARAWVGKNLVFSCKALWSCEQVPTLPRHACPAYLPLTFHLPSAYLPLACPRSAPRSNGKGAGPGCTATVALQLAGSSWEQLGQVRGTGAG